MPVVGCQDWNFIRTERASNTLHTHTASWLKNVDWCQHLWIADFSGCCDFAEPYSGSFTPWLSACQIWKVVFAQRLSRPAPASICCRSSAVSTQFPSRRSAGQHFMGYCPTDHNRFVFLKFSLLFSVQQRDSGRVEWTCEFRLFKIAFCFIFCTFFFLSFVVSTDLVCRQIFIQATTLVESAAWGIIIKNCTSLQLLIYDINRKYLQCFQSSFLFFVLLILYTLDWCLII